MINKILHLVNRTDQLVLLAIYTSAAAVILIMGTYLVLLNYLPPKLPLFYSLSWGQAQLVNKNQFLILPSLLVLLTLINILISSHLHPLQISLKRLIVFHSIFLALAILITAIKIMFVFV